MSSSGTTNFNPPISGLTLMAFSRIGIRRTEIVAEHMADADTETNLLQVEMGNKQPLAWLATLNTQILTAGTATYSLPASFIALRDAFLTIASGSSTTDRVIWSMSTEEYDAQPNKTLQAVPTQIWINRLISPTVTLWPVPDSSATYTLNMRILTQIQDASQTSGTTLNMPYRFIDVFVAGLAHRLSRIYKPEIEQLRKADYLEAWANASAQDLDDDVSLYVTPDFTNYYR